ncbi:acyl-ACP thioesterase [Ruminiclostridium herbifermentans]|uniref:Acyl-ACP thioesterase n=1 Tax=Ruminiclostridium herbifermentans TaxID=2488810 RepID=A0A4U7JCL4_9FIRM|nr:acyl-ACP thioesterase domain-containing protein [Ruminiclostridium herbifermentans]QNU67749.1 acyl-ACP thioesterase [Ruminiclostridium herbifermentans]
MEPLYVFEKNYNVTYGDSDYYKRLKISSLFNFIQDVAGLHTKHMGIGIDDISKEHGLAWVIVRIMVDIIRIPIWNEEICIETWPATQKKVEFERDFCVKDKNGNILINVISSWVLMDIAKREIIKTDSTNIKHPPLIKERAINRRMTKLRPNGELIFVYNKKISYSDIDINGHMNNSKYIDFIADCFTMEKHCEYKVENLQVNYICEALAGDVINFYKDVSQLESGIVYVEGANTEKDKVYFKACIKVRRNNE